MVESARSQARYKVAKEGVEIGEFDKQELLQLYYDQKITLSDYVWREGMSEWKTLYELYTEFLETPEQLRAYDREIQMTTKTSYRIKYLINKSRRWIKEKRKQPAKNKKIMAELEKEVQRIKKKIENARDLDEEEDLKSDLLRAEVELDSFPSIGDGRDDEEYVAIVSEETKEEIETLKNMRESFWWITFDKDPPRLNKRDLKRLTQSYERRVDQILRGSVPWSSNYFELGSLFSMPSNRALYEAYGKNYIRPKESEIPTILKRLDEAKPEWDDKNPELFYSTLKPISLT